jgi:hypothetical protein
MPKVDENGIITEGRFQGYRAVDVLEFAESVETNSAGGEGTPPGGTAPRPPLDPSAKLNADSTGRVDRTMMLLASQQEKADEDAFAATVSDYDRPVPGLVPEKTYRQVIAETKAGMSIEQRIQQGFHRRVYILVKTQQDPDAMARVVRRDPEPTPAEEEEAAEEPTPSPRNEVPDLPPEPKPAAKAAPPKKASGPAAPTPGARAEPKASAKPTLQLNDKIRRFTKKMGLNEGEYLLELQRRGFTQADVDRYSTGVGPTRPAGRKSVFDYVDE